MERREYSDVLAQGIMAVNAERDLGAIYKTFIVNLVHAGMSAKDVSRYCPESERTIQRWVKTADEEGFEALRPKERPGRARRLSEEQRHAIKGALEKEPNQYGYAEWNGKTLSDYILKTYQVTLGVRQCQRLFRELNYALIRPQIHPYHKADAAEREEFKKKLKSLRNDPKIILVSQDEVHFMQQTSVTRKWYPKGSVPLVGSAPGRVGASYSGFVTLKDGCLFVTELKRFNYETTIAAIREFLSFYPLPADCKIYMIMDNASWHRKAKRLIRDEGNPEYQDIRDKVVFLDMPPYSPDLNPIEQVWRVTRREVTHNRYFSSLSSLTKSLDEYFKQYRTANQKIISLCAFRFDAHPTRDKKRIMVGMSVA